jgi:hypothetical protein
MGVFDPAVGRYGLTSALLNLTMNYLPFVDK